MSTASTSTSPTVPRAPSAGGDTCAPLGPSVRFNGDCQYETDGSQEEVENEEPAVIAMPTDVAKGKNQATSVAGDGRDLSETKDVVEAGYHCAPNL